MDIDDSDDKKQTTRVQMVNNTLTFSDYCGYPKDGKNVIVKRYFKVKNTMLLRVERKRLY